MYHSCDLTDQNFQYYLFTYRKKAAHLFWNICSCFFSFLLQDFFIEGSRIEAAFRKYIHRANVEQEHDSVDVLVCHGNVIRYFVCRGLQFPAEAWLRFAVHNGSITVMTINKKGDVIVTALGESGHLPVDKLTFN